MIGAACLALAMYLEAGIEPPTGQMAVGFVVVNSAKTMHLREVTICREVFSGRYVAVNKWRRNNQAWPSSRKYYNVVKRAKLILSGKMP